MKSIWETIQYNNLNVQSNIEARVKELISNIEQE